METGPKLIQNLATGKWLLKLESGYWHVRSTTDATDLAGFLQIHIIDQRSSDYLVVVNGTAGITEIDDVEGCCRVQLIPLRSPETPQDITIFPEQVDFGVIELLQGFHEDGWVATEASIGMENVRSLGLKFFLPDIPDKGEKAIDIYLADKKINSQSLLRGEPTEIWVDVASHDDSRQMLTLKSAYKEPNAHDERDLGMIILEYNPNLTDWAPAKDLL